MVTDATTLSYDHALTLTGIGDVNGRPLFKHRILVQVPAAEILLESDIRPRVRQGRLNIVKKVYHQSIVKKIR